MDYQNECRNAVWTAKASYDAVEGKFFGKETLSAGTQPGIRTNITKHLKETKTPLVKQVQEIRAYIRGARDSDASVPVASNTQKKLEDEVATLKNVVEGLQKKVLEMYDRLAGLEKSANNNPSEASQNGPMREEPVVEEDDDDDVDLFGSDDEEEDADAQRIREERLAAYAEKKSKKAGPIAKSSVLLDVKPWDDETDLKKMEANVRAIEMEGLVWGAAKTVPLAFGIHKLSILCTVEDEKVSIDDLTEKIELDEEFVQSVDIASFNKV